MEFPSNKTFAFSMFDDADGSTVNNTSPVYGFLTKLGFAATKSVWPLPADPRQPYAGESLRDRDYADFIRALQRDGHEIALHNVRNADSTRSVVKEGLAEFESVTGHPPTVHANHMFNRDNLYWGAERLSGGGRRAAYAIAARLLRGTLPSEGHRPESPYFWGDLCRERIRYVRNFSFGEINLNRVNPSMPYHDPSKPFVPFWFSSCEGGNVSAFCQTISEQNQDRLEAEGGICIMYCHLASGFFNGAVHKRFAELMQRLARKNGWFVPVTTLLDYLLEKRGGAIPAAEVASMEKRWLLHKFRIGPS